MVNSIPIIAVTVILLYKCLLQNPGAIKLQGFLRGSTRFSTEVQGFLRRTEYLL